MEKKLVPYSIYLPAEYIEKLKVLARDRKASSMIRHSIGMMIEGNTKKDGAYIKGLKDAIKVVKANKECQMISINGKALRTILAEEITQLGE